MGSQEVKFHMRDGFPLIEYSSVISKEVIENYKSVYLEHYLADQSNQEMIHNQNISSLIKECDNRSKEGSKKFEHLSTEEINEKFKIKDYALTQNKIWRKAERTKIKTRIQMLSTMLFQAFNDEINLEASFTKEDELSKKREFRKSKASVNQTETVFCPCCRLTLDELRANGQYFCTTICGHFICLNCSNQLISSKSHHIFSLRCPVCRHSLYMNGKILINDLKL